MEGCGKLFIKPIQKRRKMESSLCKYDGVCVCVSIDVCTCAQQLGADLKCLPQSLSIFFFETESLTELIDSTRLAGHRVPGKYLSLHPLAGVANVCCPPGFLCGCWGYKLGPLLALGPLSHLPSPRKTFNPLETAL